MAYVRIGKDESTLGSLGCGPGCSCAGCRQTAAGVNGLGERYVPEEKEAPSPPPTQPPPQRPAPALPPRSNLSGWGRFGEPLLQRRSSPTGGLQLRMPAFATLTGFARGGAGLNAAQFERVKRAAEFIAQSWSGASPITSIRITGYIDGNEQSDLGQRRAGAVRDALLRAIDSTRPGLATRLQWILEDRGFSPIAKVEIYLWHGPTPPPVPPLVRVPSLAETIKTAGETATRLLSQKKRQPILFGASLTEDFRRKGVGQASMLGQHSPKQLPDWMKAFLITVDKYYRNNTHLFFILSLHPQPFAVQALRPISNKIISDYVEHGGRGPLPVFWWGELRSELARIRARRQLDDKDFSRLLFEHLQLFQEVDKSFKTFKREDLKPFLIEVLLASGRVGKGVPHSDPKNWRSPTLGTRSSQWNLGKRFVKERLPQALSKRVAESPWYVQEVINARLANSLWVMANQFQYENPAFRKELEMEEKARAKRS